ncbi:MAG: B12-binding domain-containing radical SAM protein [Atribacterota bacterium]
MKKNDIIFIVCPPFWEKLPPLGIAYLKEYLNRNGYESKFCDLNMLIFHLCDENMHLDWTINTEYTTKDFFNYCHRKFPHVFNNLIEWIKKTGSKFIGFSICKSNREFSLQTAGLIKKIFPDINIVFGGPEVFTMEQKGFEDVKGADYYVVGEGEKAVCKILQGRSRKNIYRYLQLNDINFYPSFRGIDLNSYIRNNGLPVLFSRGCVKNCSFCSESKLFKGYRVKDPDVMTDEFKFHIKENNIKWFTFYDSILNGDLNKLESLLDLIIKSGIKISWDAQMAIRQEMDLEIMRKMKKAGCVNLFIGLESGSDKILESMNKKYSSKDAGLFLSKLNNANLNYEVSLIVNFPGETEIDFKKTINFIKENKNNIKKIAQINHYKHYPGTKIYKNNINKNKSNRKVDTILNLLDEEGIGYTSKFIQNLI